MDYSIIVYLGKNGKDGYVLLDYESADKRDADLHSLEDAVYEAAKPKKLNHKLGAFLPLNKITFLESTIIVPGVRA